MDFELGPELERLKQEAREFAEQHVRPFAGTWDVEQRFPSEAVDKLRGRPFLALTIPEQYGGMLAADGSRGGNLALCVILEEINRACPSTGVTVSVHNSLMNSPLTKWGSADQHQRYLPKLASGEWLGAYCLSEAGAGSDAAALRCAARKDGSDWVLDGAKLWITTGDQADLFIIFARTGEHRTKGISAFLVEASSPGIRPAKKEVKLGIRASPTNEILLEGCRVPAANLLGEEGEGFTIALDTLDGGRLGIAAQSLGIGRACLEDAVEFAAARPMGSKRLADHQAVQWRLAEIATELDAARLLTYRAAILRDRGDRCTQQSAMAKLIASRACNNAARKVIGVLGLECTTRLHGFERYLRDARITEIYEGVTDIQKLVIARGLFAE